MLPDTEKELLDNMDMVSVANEFAQDNDRKMHCLEGFNDFFIDHAQNDYNTLTLFASESTKKALKVLVL